MPREEWEQLSSKGKAETNQILKIFQDHPEEAFSVADVTELTGLESQSVQYHLRKLKKELDSRKKGRQNFYALKK
jgi:predicted transcriptional regulator